MSKFKTSIPVDLDAIKNALPGRSFINSIEFDRERGTVSVLWENDDFKTPYTFPVDWQDLAKIPAGVCDVKNMPAAPKLAVKAALKMHAPVSGQQTSSQSQPAAKPNDAAAVKKKPAK